MEMIRLDYFSLGYQSDKRKAVLGRGAQVACSSNCMACGGSNGKLVKSLEIFATLREVTIGSVL